MGSGGGGGCLQAESLPPRSPHRRKQGRYNLFSWLSMKVRGRGTSVCLDLTPTTPSPTVYFFGLSSHSRPPLSIPCILRFSHSSRTPRRSHFVVIHPLSLLLIHHFSHLPLLLFHTSFSFVSSLRFSRQVAVGSVAFWSDYYVNNYHCPRRTNGAESPGQREQQLQICK